jgi:hypothetical protein
LPFQGIITGALEKSIVLPNIFASSSIKKGYLMLGDDSDWVGIKVLKGSIIGISYKRISLLSYEIRQLFTLKGDYSYTRRIERDMFVTFRKANVTTCTRGRCGNWMIYNMHGKFVAGVNRICWPDKGPCKTDTSLWYWIFTESSNCSRGISIVDFRSYIPAARGTSVVYSVFSFRTRKVGDWLYQYLLESLSVQSRWRNDIANTKGFRVPGSGDIVVIVENNRVERPYRNIYLLRKSKGFKKSEIFKAHFPAELHHSGKEGGFGDINNRVLYMSRPNGVDMLIKVVIKGIEFDCNINSSNVTEAFDRGVDYVKYFVKWTDFAVDKTGNTIALPTSHSIRTYRIIPDLY